MSRDWSLIAGHEPGAIGWALLIVCVGAALLEALFTLRRATTARVGSVSGTSERRRRAAAIGVLALRMVAIAALVAVVLELGVRVETWTGSSRRVVVLIDHSASLGLADSPASARPGQSTTRRWTRVTELWRDGADARAAWREGDRGEAGVDIEVRGFASQARPLTADAAESLDGLEPTGEASDLTRALVELAESEVGEGTPLAAVVVISDGLVVHAADRGQAEAEADHLRAVADELGVPVTTVAAGGPTIRDVAIAELHVGEFAFVENVTEFSAELIAHGLEGERATVELLRDGAVVDEQRIRLRDDGETQTVGFEIAPDRTGQFVYAFRVALDDEDLREATTANNRRAFVIKILRDKVRVLHVAGRPDWDVRALRTLLKRDPNVELLSYYILRDWEDTIRDDGTAPMSLIAFPMDELFREQLGSFDLILMHNYDAKAHDTHLRNVAEYVREGGSVVLIGGDLGMATGDFTEQAIVDIMPVDLRRATGLVREPFSPLLTEAGRRHPITAWLAESGRTDWRDLPALDSFNPAPTAGHAEKISGTVLLHHPDQTDARGQPVPLLAVAEPDAGRVMTLATGATWRLGFAPDLPLIEGARPYDLLWLGAVRWLLRDDSAERLVLEIGKREHALDEPIDLSVRTLSASYAPEPDVEIGYRIVRLDTPEGRSPDAIAEGTLTTDGLGRAATRIAPLPAGAYEAEAWRAEDAPADEDDPELGQAARRVFLVGAGGRELARVDADPGTALLRGLAEASGGEFVDAVVGDELPDDLPMIDLDELDRPPNGRRDVPLWDGWTALLLLIGAFGGEWILRRRTGLS